MGTLHLLSASPRRAFTIFPWTDRSAPPWAGGETEARKCCLLGAVRYAHGFAGVWTPAYSGDVVFTYPWLLPLKHSFWAFCSVMNPDMSFPHLSSQAQSSEPRGANLSFLLVEALLLVVSTCLGTDPSMVGGVPATPPSTISTSWAPAASHLLPSFLLPFPSPPCLLLPWEELFLGAASWDVLLGAGYHEGNVTKTVGKGCRHPEPCWGHGELGG